MEVDLFRLRTVSGKSWTYVLHSPPTPALPGPATEDVYLDPVSVSHGHVPDAPGALSALLGGRGKDVLRRQTGSQTD